MRALYFALIILLAAPNAVLAQAMRVVTSGPGPGLHVVVTWPPNAGISQYNLYRKTIGQTNYPPAPLNAQPIARAKACVDIQAVILPNSEDWIILAKGLSDSPSVDFDPCNIPSIIAGSAKESRLLFLARARWRIAVVSGLAYDDKSVTNGTGYEYELRSVNAVGVETGLIFTNIGVTAGSPSPIPPPPNLTATAGDHRVLLLWGSSTADGFLVLRATNSAGPFSAVNKSTLITQIKQDLDGNPLATPAPGLLDIQRWDSNGQPTTHQVGGISIGGPANGVTYFYKVTSLDLLGQEGPPGAAAVSAKPVDKTPPAAPTGVKVTAIDNQNRLEVRWNRVEFDVDGHAEAATLSGYKLFRYDSENAPPASGLPIGGLIPSPPVGQTFVVASDNSPDLRPAFGEKTFWYRVQAIDVSGNGSAHSAAVGGNLKDITPPAPPKNLTAKGFDDFIQLQWEPNSEPDLDGYQIYRSLCHNGQANPCDQPSPDRPPATKGQKSESAAPSAKDNKYDVPCTGSYILIGTVSLAEAKNMGTTVTFADRSVPKGSPLCYSYWIKAIDRTQNRSGAWPIPDPATEKTVCQRLRDKTPPEPAIISGLFARDQAIRVEWIGPPVQDIRAYHVYRSEAEAGPYKWVGGMTVEPPPNPPVMLSQPYKPPPVVGCDKIPVVAISSMSMGFLIDKLIEAKRVYWYKVVGIDQSGNEAPVDKAVPVSTFSFTTSLPPSPTIISITGTTAAPFGLVVRWNPAFDATQHQGFAIFRSNSSTGIYRQIGTLFQGSEYQDNNVVRGLSYWYKVVQMDRSGQVSQPSMAASGSLP